MIQSFQARTQARPSSGSSVIRMKFWPANPGRADGKFSEAYNPLRSMSAMRASMSHAPRRIWSNRTGSKPYSDTGRPATAFIPTVGNRRPSTSQACIPSSSVTTMGPRSPNRDGMRPSKASGASTTWSSTEMMRLWRFRRSGSGKKVTGWASAWLSRTVNPMRPMSESLTTATAPRPGLHLDVVEPADVAGHDGVAHLV